MTDESQGSGIPNHWRHESIREALSTLPFDIKAWVEPVVGLSMRLRDVRELYEFIGASDDSLGDQLQLRLLYPGEPHRKRAAWLRREVLHGSESSHMRPYGVELAVLPRTCMEPPVRREVRCRHLAQRRTDCESEVVWDCMDCGTRVQRYRPDDGFGRRDVPVADAVAL